jgi:hypothetical protein
LETLVWVALGLALASLGLSGAGLVLSLRRLPTPSPAPLPVQPSLPEPVPSPLEGLGVVLAISQDHAHPVFVGELSEILRKLDAEVSTIPSEQAAEYRRQWPMETDLMISGHVVCNGYSEVYYRAELACFTPSDTICTVIDNPASGDRQSNLATELVSKIETEITKRVSRQERRLALKELRGIHPKGS